jgi:hypothetical protein
LLKQAATVTSASVLVNVMHELIPCGSSVVWKTQAQIGDQGMAELDGLGGLDGGLPQ